MKFSKKAQGLPMQTIIIAVLVLLVLGIMAFILIKGTGRFTRGVGECESRQGKCEESCPSSHPIQVFKGCYKEETYIEKNFCCIGVG